MNPGRWTVTWDIIIQQSREANLMLLFLQVNYHPNKNLPNHRHALWILVHWLYSSVHDFKHSMYIFCHGLKWNDSALETANEMTIGQLVWNGDTIGVQLLILSLLWKRVQKSLSLHSLSDASVWTSAIVVSRNFTCVECTDCHMAYVNWFFPIKKWKLFVSQSRTKHLVSVMAKPRFAYKTTVWCAYRTVYMCVSKDSCICTVHTIGQMQRFAQKALRPPPPTARTMHTHELLRISINGVLIRNNHKSFLDYSYATKQQTWPTHVKKFTSRERHKPWQPEYMPPQSDIYLKLVHMQLCAHTTIIKKIFLRVPTRTNDVRDRKLFPLQRALRRRNEMVLFSILSCVLKLVSLALLLPWIIFTCLKLLRAAPHFGSSFLIHIW